MDTHSSDKGRVAERVRASGISAAIGAACLLYFGFASLLEPEATDLFSTSNLIFYHTARWGGVLMAGTAVWLWTGHLGGLLADGVIATLIGVLLVVTGLGMAVGGGDMLQTLINFFCGYMFYSSGIRNARDYFRLAQKTSATAANAREVHAMTHVEPASFTSRTQPEQPTPVTERTECEPVAPTREPAADPSPDLDASPSPPGGYLASFAKKDSNEDS